MSAACIGIAIVAVTSLSGRTLTLVARDPQLTISTPTGLQGITGPHAALVAGTESKSEVDLSSPSSASLTAIELTVVPQASTVAAAVRGPLLSLDVRRCSVPWSPADAPVTAPTTRVRGAVCPGSTTVVARDVPVGPGGAQVALHLARSGAGRSEGMAHLQLELRLAPGASPGTTGPPAVQFEFAVPTVAA